MTRHFFDRVPTFAGALTLSLALSQGWISIASAEGIVSEQATAPAAQQQAPQAAEPAEAAEAAPSAPALAKPAAEAPPAADRMEASQQEMREHAGARGIEIPEPPSPPEAPRWLSYEEMRAEMKRRGIDIAPRPQVPSAPRPPQQPASSVPKTAAPAAPPAVMGGMSAEEQKRVFDVIEAMTPEQQQACFALSRWQRSALMHRPTPSPMHGRPMGQGKGYGTGHPRGFHPGHRFPGQGPMMIPHR